MLLKWKIIIRSISNDLVWSINIIFHLLYWQKHYENDSLAKKAVMDGSTWGIIQFEKNFTDMIFMRYDDPTEISSDFIDESAISSSLDMSSNWKQIKIL